MQTDIKAATAFLALLTGSLALASGSPQDADYEAGYELGKQLGGPEGRQRVDPDAVYRGLVDGLEAARSGTDKRKHLRGRTGALADDFALPAAPGRETMQAAVLRPFHWTEDEGAG